MIGVGCKLLRLRAMDRTETERRKIKMQPLVQIECPIRHYPWGGYRKEGEQQRPYICDLLNAEPPAGLPFAEMWIGAHPADPSLAMDETGRKVPLDRMIAANPEFWLGPDSRQNSSSTLPFLLKILDSAKPLSIQTHPNRNLAVQLHRRQPRNYPDTNHKPEVAIALETGLEAFCRFRTRPEIQRDFERLPPLQKFFREVNSKKQPQWLREITVRWLTADSEEVAGLLSDLQQEPAVAPSPQRTSDHWFLRLLQDYPRDRGCLAAWLLNIVRLEPGQAIFIQPGEPHAYLHGTIIECMASSDNVIRAGLTDKPTDIPTLLQALDFDCGPPDIATPPPSPADLQTYRGSAAEFQVEILRCKNGELRSWQEDSTVSLLLVLDGRVRLATEGWSAIAERGTAWAWPAAVENIQLHGIADQSRIVRARPAQTTT